MKMKSDRSLRDGVLIVAAVVAPLCIPLLAHYPHDAMSVVAVAPGNTVFIATQKISSNIGFHLALRSTDNAVTWDVLEFPNIPVTSVVVSPDYTDDDTLFFGTTGKGVWISTDEGASWADAGAPSSLINVTALAISPNFSNESTFEAGYLFAVGDDNALFEYDVDSDSWTELSDCDVESTGDCFDGYLSAGGVIQSIAVSPDFAADDRVFVGTNCRGVFMSSDVSGAWDQVNSGLPDPAGICPSYPIRAIAISPDYDTNETLYVATEGKGVYYSDGDVSGEPDWHARGLTSREVTNLAIISDDLFATVAEDPDETTPKDFAAIHKSTDGGANWTSTTIPRDLETGQNDEHYLAVAISPDFATSDLVFLATYEGLWRSDDAGATWIYSHTITNRTARGISFSPDFESDQTAFAALYGGGVITTTPSGWEVNNTGLTNVYSYSLEVSPNFASDSILSTGIFLGLQRTTNAGDSWSLGQVDESATNTRAHAYSPDFTSDDRVFLGTNAEGIDICLNIDGNYFSRGGVWLSTDKGVTFVEHGLNNAHIYDLAVSPDYANDDTIFAAVGVDSSAKLCPPPTGVIAGHAAGIWRTENDGADWTKQEDGRFGTIGVVEDSGGDLIVYAGKVDGGLWVSTNNGDTFSAVGNTSAWEVTDIAIHPDFDTNDVLFVGTLRHGLQSWDGTGFDHIDEFDTQYITRVAVSPTFPDTTPKAVLVAPFGSFYASINGTTFAEVHPIFRSEDNASPSIVYSDGDWAPSLDEADASARFISEAAVTTCSSPGDISVEFGFVGTKVTVVAKKASDQGKIDVSIDGGTAVERDLYAASTQWQQSVYDSGTLSMGYHTITVVPTGNQHENATGCDINIDAFDVTF